MSQFGGVAFEEFSSGGVMEEEVSDFNDGPWWDLAGLGDWAEVGLEFCALG